MFVAFFLLSTTFWFCNPIELLPEFTSNRSATIKVCLHDFSLAHLEGEAFNDEFINVRGYYNAMDPDRRKVHTSAVELHGEDYLNPMDLFIIHNTYMTMGSKFSDMPATCVPYHTSRMSTKTK